MGISPQYVVLFHHFRRFLKKASEKGIDVAPLKGAHLLTSVYGNDEDRGMLADVDFLVRPRDWERTTELLVSMGFERGKEIHRPATFKEFYEACYFLPIGGDKRILFEPHRYLIQPMRHNIDYDALWKRSEESVFDGARCRRLSPEDHVLHLAIHMMTDSFIRPMRGLNDMEHLFKVGKADLETILNRAKSWECQRPTWLALELLSEKTPDLEIRERMAMLQVPRAVKTALRILVPDASGFIFPELGLRARQGITFPLLMDGTRPLMRFGSYYLGLRTRDFLQKKLKKNN